MTLREEETGEDLPIKGEERRRNRALWELELLAPDSTAETKDQ